MTQIHDLIDACDIPGLNQYLASISINEINQPNQDNIFPIEYVVSKFNPSIHHTQTFIVLIQTLLNRGCEMDKLLLSEIANEQGDDIKQFINQVLSLKGTSKIDRFSRPNMRPNQVRSKNIMTKSNYSEQERIQLEQIANRHGVLTKPSNHLALRIINKLEQLLESYNHFKN